MSVRTVCGRVMLVRSAGWMVCGLLLTLPIGCSKSGAADGPPGAPVTGSVVYQGLPVSEATVTFVSPQHSAVGLTDNEGRFHLVAAGREDSVPLGDYKVTVVKLSAPQIIEPTTEQQYTIPNPNAPPPNPPKDLLPPKYKTEASSGLTASVTAGGPNEFKFELTD